MPFQLRAELPEGYSSSRMGQEPWVEIDAANSLLLENGQHERDGNTLRAIARESGFVTIKDDIDNAIVGVAIAERLDSGVVDVENVLVKPEHRRKGLAGFMVGRLIVGVSGYSDHGVTKAYYGNTLRISTENGGYERDPQKHDFILPGALIEISAGKLCGNERIVNELMPRGWNGIRTVWGDGIVADSHTVYRNGAIVAELERPDVATTRIANRSTEFSHVAFAAMAVLNDTLELV